MVLCRFIFPVCLLHNLVRLFAELFAVWVRNGCCSCYYCCFAAVFFWLISHFRDISLNCTFIREHKFFPFVVRNFRKTVYNNMVPYYKYSALVFFLHLAFFFECCFSLSSGFATALVSVFRAQTYMRTFCLVWK